MKDEEKNELAVLQKERLMFVLMRLNYTALFSVLKRSSVKHEFLNFLFVVPDHRFLLHELKKKQLKPSGADICFLKVSFIL